MRYVILILFALVTVGCQQPPPKPAPEKVKSETEQVVEIIRNQPEWLKEEIVCPTEIFPKNETEFVYHEDNCKSSPKECLENCENENGGDCYSLAILIQRQIDSKQNEANPLFYRACKFGIISGCTNLAAGKFDPESGDSASLKCSVDTFEKTCEKDDPWGCTMFGMVLASGKGRQQNSDEALKVLSKSCKYGIEDEACSRAEQLKQTILTSKNRKKK